MTTGDIILFADWQASRGKPREERNAALEAAERDRIYAMQLAEIRKAIVADGVAR